MTDQEKKTIIKEEVKARLQDTSIWVYFLHLVLYGFAFVLSSWVLFASVVLHFILRLLTGEPNPELQKFAKNLSVYLAEIVQFANFNSDKTPFPLSPWPNAATNHSSKYTEQE